MIAETAEDDMVISPPATEDQVSDLDNLGNAFSNSGAHAKTNMFKWNKLKNLDGIQNGIIWNCRGVKTASEIKKLCLISPTRFLISL